VQLLENIMKTKILLAATAAVALCASAAAKADPDDYRNNPNNYYSQTDHDGYYDRNGNYHHFRDYGPPPPPREGGYERSGYYYDADRDPECHRGGNAAGTIAGAIGGGLIGGVASHGNGLAIAGGAIVGGLVGNALTRDVDCADRPYAYNSYYRGLNGDVGVRVDWDNNSYGDRGYFVPTREYYRGSFRCRDFHSVTYRHGREVTRDGTACKRNDGQWEFES
jgi:surface antigen